MFGMRPTTVSEKCSCGATFNATGMYAASGAYSWRTSHPCSVRRATWVWSRQPLSEAEQKRLGVTRQNPDPAPVSRRTETTEG